MKDAAMTATPPPDRSAFVAYAIWGYADCATMDDFWRFVDRIMERRVDLCKEGNAAANEQIRAAARAAFDRLQQKPSAA